MIYITSHQNFHFTFWPYKYYKLHSFLYELYFLTISYYMSYNSLMCFYLLYYL